jgi:hypothetical protein
MRMHHRLMTMLLLLASCLVLAGGSIVQPVVSSSGPPCTTPSMLTDEDSYANQGALLFDLKALLLSAGWTLDLNGGGTVGNCYSPGEVDCATLINLQAGDGAWFTLRTAYGAGSIEVLFAEWIGVTGWKMILSPTAAFAGGDTDTHATAVDERYQVGDATHFGNPTGGTWGVANDCKLGADRDSVSFFFTCWSGAVSGTTMWLDELIAYDAADTMPLVLYWNTNAETCPYGWGCEVTYNGPPRGFFDFGGAGEAWATVYANGPAYYDVGYKYLYPSALPANPGSARDNIWRVLYGTSATGAKGKSRIVSWQTMTVQRADGDTYGYDWDCDGSIEADVGMVSGNLVFAWDGSAGAASHDAQDVSLQP